MRVSKEAQEREIERFKLETAGKWFPTRWWRLVSADDQLLAESSDEEEIRGFARETPGSRVEHLYEKHKWDWREE